MQTKKDLDYYKKLRYKVIVQPEYYENEKWFIAYCNELGKYSCRGEGETYEEAVKNFEKEKESFIEYLYKNNKNIPEPENYESKEYSGNINIRMNPDLHAILAENAKLKGISLNQYIIFLLTQNVTLDAVSREFGSRFDHFIQDFNSIANEYMRNRIQYNKSLIFENKKRIERLESKLDDSIRLGYGLTG
ncbi:MAG: toxin-antitoxin system HicB family antitoxin [Calditrichaeota bacterium]|nr:toxin-antitoxin system HicB family antitoxin [Calditrichota bacterium]